MARKQELTPVAAETPQFKKQAKRNGSKATREMIERALAPSPDRADAMVWEMTALSETRSGVPRVRRL